MAGPIQQVRKSVLRIGAADGNPSVELLTRLTIPHGVSASPPVSAFLKQHMGSRVRHVSDVLSNAVMSIGTARTVIIEHGYFDIDNRSEDAATLVSDFNFDRPLTLRLHFFAEVVEADHFEQWQLDGTMPEEQFNYLGYMVPRYRRGTVTVGRAILSPGATQEPLRDPAQFHTRVRTLVREAVNLYGVSLHAVGVPFMQQDSGLTSCAHVTAWMAHYCSVLRGLTRRATVAQLRESSDTPTGEFGRQYPTQGLADIQVLRALTSAGLAPEIVYVQDLAKPRPARWSDRQEIHDRGDSFDWHTENLTAAVSRYLNSGLPVIVSRNEHATLVCGYLRRKELAVEGDTDQQLVSHFIVHDEGEGPYRSEPVARILEALDDDLSPDALTLIIPLPRHLLLSGEDAEDVGTEAFSRHCRETLEREEDAESHPSGTAAIESIRKTVELLEGHKLAVRSYACWSTDYKASIRERTSTEVVVRQCSFARLPRFVWVVEVIDRDRRNGGEDSVVGEVVIDATATSRKEASEILVRVPGHIEYRDPVSGARSGRFFQPYFAKSARWTRENPWWYGSIEERSKVC